MNYAKTISKMLISLVVGSISAVVANPDSITTLAGASHAGQVGAIVALLSGLINWYKNKDKEV